jgi:tetratricopeptide (TPR) repeat protein
MQSWHDTRFATRRTIALLLRALGRGEEAHHELESAAKALLTSSREELGSDWDALAKANERIAEARYEVGNVEGSVEAYRAAAAVQTARFGSPVDKLDPNALVRELTGLSWYQVLARQFAEAQATVEKGLGLVAGERDKYFLQTNLALALLFQGKMAAARDIYEDLKGRDAGPDKDGKPRIFASVLLSDITKLETIGLSHAEFTALRTSLNETLAAKARKEQAERAAREAAAPKTAFLGVSYEAVTRDIATQLSLQHSEGVRITQLLPDGPAAKAGLLVGDVILQLDGKPVGGNLKDPIENMRPGQKIVVAVWRDHRQLEVQAILGAR